jgi:hypothetical protein
MIYWASSENQLLARHKTLDEYYLKKKIHLIGTRTHDLPVCIIFFYFNLHSGGGWSPNWVHSARRPLTGLLYLPRVIVRMEKIGGMNGRGNRSTRRKPAPTSLRPPQIPLDQTRDWTRAAAVGSQRLWRGPGMYHSASSNYATACPHFIIVLMISQKYNFKYYTLCNFLSFKIYVPLLS